MQTSSRMVPLLFAVVSLAGGRELSAQCVSTLGRTNANGDLVRLDGVMISDSQLTAGANYWSACSGYGNDFASFTTANVSASVSVTVTYYGGHN